MTISVGETWASFDGGILSAILQVLTRYSANDPQFPANDRAPFTGKSHVVGGADRPPHCSRIASAVGFDTGIYDAKRAYIAKICRVCTTLPGFY